MTAALSIRGIRKTFGGLRAVDGVSFDIAEGEHVALIGPNGAGKSTLFDLLSGAGRADPGGVMTFMGRDITSLPPHRRQRLGIGRTFQIAAVFRSMSVRENVAAALMAAGRPVDDAHRLLIETGIDGDPDRPIDACAYGDVKRVELAMALAAEPALLLLDEPTAGMAGTERRDIMETVTRLASDRGAAILFTEHDMDAVFGFAARVLVLDEGRLIADGTADAVRANADVQRVYLGDGVDA